MTNYLTCAETAKLVRSALKTEFPGVRFSVRSISPYRRAYLSTEIGFKTYPVALPLEPIIMKGAWVFTRMTSGIVIASHLKS